MFIRTIYHGDVSRNAFTVSYCIIYVLKLLPTEFPLGSLSLLCALLLSVNYQRLHGIELKDCIN